MKAWIYKQWFARNSSYQLVRANCADLSKPHIQRPISKSEICHGRNVYTIKTDNGQLLTIY